MLPAVAASGLARPAQGPYGTGAVVELAGEDVSRLIGIGASGLGPAEDADRPDLIDVAAGTRAKAELAMDRMRERFGEEAVFKGRKFDIRMWSFASHK
jgi:hypothetical protein